MIGACCHGVTYYPLITKQYFYVIKVQWSPRYQFQLVIRVAVKYSCIRRLECCLSLSIIDHPWVRRHVLLSPWNPLSLSNSLISRFLACSTTGDTPTANANLDLGLLSIILKRDCWWYVFALPDFILMFNASCWMAGLTCMSSTDPRLAPALVSLVYAQAVAECITTSCPIAKL